MRVPNLAADDVEDDDVKFFDKHPDRTYRVRPFDPREARDFNGGLVDEKRFQPAVIVKRFRHNGYDMVMRKLFGAPKDIDLYDVSEELARRIFEPTTH